MKIISVEDYLPGTKVKECLYIFDDGVCEIYSPQKHDILGKYIHMKQNGKFIRDFNTGHYTHGNEQIEANVTHWIDITAILKDL